MAMDPSSYARLFGEYCHYKNTALTQMKVALNSVLKVKQVDGINQSPITWRERNAVVTERTYAHYLPNTVEEHSELKGIETLSQTSQQVDAQHKTTLTVCLNIPLSIYMHFSLVDWVD
jgi:hypothetical protein